MECEAYIDEVMKFRKALNLTSIRDPQQFYDRFVVPSLALQAWMPDHGRMLDIGSGMGVPGIPLLMAKPGITGVLVERRKKRAEFLRHVVRKLRLNAEVYDADINHLPSLDVDICIARAVTEEEELLRMCSSHANSGAVAVLPVPYEYVPSDVEGWQQYDQQDVKMAGDGIQRIRCYRYCEQSEGGFT